MSKNVAVDEFAIFDQIAEKSKACLEHAVQTAAESVAKERERQQATESKRTLAEATAEYQKEVKMETQSAETKRTRANNKALKKATGNGTTAPEQPKAKSHYGNHREGTQGFMMDEAIEAVVTNLKRLPTPEEVAQATSLTPERAKGHMGFLKRKGTLPEFPEVPGQTNDASPDQDVGEQAE